MTHLNDPHTNNDDSNIGSNEASEVSEVSPGSAKSSGSGIRALTAQEFSALDSVGGLRGLVESIAPGLIYLVLFIATKNLSIALIGSLAVAAIMVIARLVTRTPVTMAFSGVIGVGIGLFVAWRTGEAQTFYLWGLFVNAVWGLGCLLSLLVKWPAVGVIVELLKGSLSASTKPEATLSTPETNEAASSADLDLDADTGSDSNIQVDEHATSSAQPLFPTEWRSNALLMRSYITVTWLWVGMFLARIVVQLPLYLGGEGNVAALGAARLIMGVPLFALVLWLSWLIIRLPAPVEGPQE